MKEWAEKIKRFVNTQLHYKLPSTFWFDVFSSILVVLMALGIGGILLVLSGTNPLTLFECVFIRSIVRAGSLRDMLLLWAVLLISGLSSLIPFKAGIWNLGTEGQMFMGALGATIVFTLLYDQGNIALLIMVALLFGAIWGGIAGILKAKLGSDEIITTVLLNLIAMLITTYAVGQKGPLRDPRMASLQSYPIPNWAKLPFFLGTSLNTGIIASFLLAILTYLIITRTTLGYEIGTIRGNHSVARHAGVRVERVTIIVMLIGGALGGLAGLLLLIGITRILMVGFSHNYGYIGIAIAVLAKLHPVAVIITSLFFTMLYIGGELFLLKTTIPLTFIHSISAVIIIASLFRPHILGRVKKIAGAGKQ